MNTDRDFIQTRSGGRLVAVLANPPLSDGATTRARVQLAREILGFQEMRLSNLFAHPTRTSLDIARCGISDCGWIAARHLLTEELRQADGVLLAYGTVEPSGPARFHYRAQLDWLQIVLDRLGLPMWQLGDGPRNNPSKSLNRLFLRGLRWQNDASIWRPSTLVHGWLASI